LSWKAHGTLSPARDNVIVYPTSYGAQQGDSVLKQVDKIGLAVRRRRDSRCCTNRAEVVADVVGGG
jgi:hypothetical protein